MRLFLWVCFFSLLMGCSSDSEESRVQAWVVDVISNLHEGDVDAYINQTDGAMETDSARLELLRQLLIHYVDEVGRKGGLERVEPLNCQICSDSMAYVSYALQFGNGSRETKVTKLIRRNGDWLFCEFE